MKFHFVTKTGAHLKVSNFALKCKAIALVFDGK